MSGIGVTNDFDISAADGVTTVFTYTFFAYDTSQVKVYSVLDDVETEITTGITITPNSSFIGGTITFAVAPLAAVGDILRRRAVPYTQTTEFTDLIRYKETAIEKALNTLAMQIQQVYSRVSRAMRYSEAAGVTETIIGTPEDGKALIFDGVTGRLKAGPTASDIANAQTNAAQTAADVITTAANVTAAQGWATAAQSAATGINWTKARAASTANVNIASPGATIDGVTLVSNDRVLLKNQSTASQNGIYVWNGSAVAMTRATDMDTWPEVVSKVVQIEEGTANADLPYMATVNTGGTLGSTSITFTLFQAPLQDGAVSTAAKIVDGIISLVKMAALSTTAKLIGSNASGTAPTEITLGTGLSMSGSTLNASNPVKAWVNFNGTGTVAIRASSGVGSITDNGTGDYTINFSPTLADANYVVQGACTNDASGPTRGAGFYIVSQTASALRVVFSYGADATTHGAAFDPTKAQISVIGN